jgi:LysM repeat protein
MSAGSLPGQRQLLRSPVPCAIICAWHILAVSPGNLPITQHGRLSFMNLNFPLAVLLLAVALLWGCATPPEPVKAPPPVAQPEPEPEVAAEPVAEPVRKEPARPLLTGPAAKAEAQKILRQAFELLNNGDEDKAKAELDYAHQIDADNKQVTCLLRGINADPVATLGRDSTSYTVRPGDSLGRIAQRALGDVCEFYILARYNQIRVPRQLAAGQVIRIPGKVALAPETASAPAPAAAPVVEPAAAPKPEVADEGAKEAAKRALVDKHHRTAQAAFRRQDLKTAIREWGRVLEIDPDNDLAKARRQEAMDLQRRIDKLKK